MKFCSNDIQHFKSYESHVNPIPSLTLRRMLIYKAIKDGDKTLGLQHFPGKLLRCFNFLGIKYATSLIPQDCESRI